MSHNRRGWEDWEPGYRRSYSDEHSRRRYEYAPPILQRSSFDYWRGDAVAPTSYYPQRPYERESYNERWHDDRRSLHAESSYSRRRPDFGPGHDRDDRESRRDRSPSHRNPSRQRYSIYTPSYIHRPTVRPKTPTDPIIPIPKPALPKAPREVSPPPNMPSQPLKPSPAYLSLSQEPSHVLRDPTMTRKLLVLDLNGTLLIRSPRSRTTSRPQLRSVQPRPYMQSFRQYLFCMETKAWLDTMVWSSAQPHSVDNMVDKLFGIAKGEMKAIWSRKSLGLSEAEYHQKTVTTKDLAKPWDLFASALSPEKHSAGLSQSQVIHSAFTTLLLDDSPHKAVLQPYSHVCVPEYDSTRRRHDLRSFSVAEEPKKFKTAKQKNQVEKAARSTAETISELLPPDGLTELENEPYDVIILAVIGILETAKLQSNVASWIRKGGLWATRESEGGNGVLDVEHRSVVETEGGKAVSDTVVRTGKEASTHLQTKMWFDDSSVVAFWVARGRRALIELGIPIVHGVTG